MHIKFLARGTGSARDAADYLLGERDAAGKPREGVEVLRGNPDMVAAVADSLDFEHKYTSGVIAWAPDDQPTDEQIGAVLDAFEETGLGGTGVRPLRMDCRAAPRARWRRSRACPGRAVRPGDRPEPQHRASGLAEGCSTRSATPSTTSTAGAGPTTRSGPGCSNPGPPHLHRGGAAAGRPPARSLPPRLDPGLPAPTG